MEEILKIIENKEIPYNYPNDFTKNFHLRSKVIEDMGFVLISKDWISPFSDWIGSRKCLEIMAGSGALSYSLMQQGVNIITTDDFSWEMSEKQKLWWNNGKLWTKIEKINYLDAIKKYGKDIDIIIMSWPYMDNMAARALIKMRKINPLCLMIYIGEGSGGCTANDRFFQLIRPIQDYSFEESVKKFKRWWGIYDYPMLVK